MTDEAGVAGRGRRSGHAGTSLVSTDVRRHNLALIARSILDHGPSSRSRLAERTGLTRGSVTALTTALLGARVLREAGSSELPPQPSVAAPPSRGRPITLLELAADDAAILVLQLDADQAIGELSTVDGTLLTRVSRQHGRPMAQPEPILDVVGQVLTETLDAASSLERRVVDTTVIVFAPVLGEPPIVIADTDLAWGAVDVLAGLRVREPRLDPASTLHSDAPLAAVAELRGLAALAAPDLVDDVVYLKSNSGIGGAVIVQGRLITGAHGFAGGLGHLPIVPDGERCACGQRGCLVTIAGPDAVLLAAGMHEILGREGLSSALETFVDRVLAGEADAVTAWTAAARWIARALRILSGTLDPEAIILGGYWAPLASTIEREFRLDAPIIPGIDAAIAPRILAGVLGERAALLGAAQLARERLLADPLALALN